MIIIIISPIRNNYKESFYGERVQVEKGSFHPNWCSQQQEATPTKEPSTWGRCRVELHESRRVEFHDEEPSCLRHGDLSPAQVYKLPKQRLSDIPRPQSVFLDSGGGRHPQDLLSSHIPSSFLILHQQPEPWNPRWCGTVEHALFADDASIWTSDIDLNKANDRLQTALTKIEQWS